MSKHGWFLTAGAAVLVAWFARAHAFFLSFSIAVAGFCVFRGYRAAKDPMGLKNRSLSDSSPIASAGPPDGGMSSAQNLPQTQMGTSAKPNWGSGRKNQMFDPLGWAPSATPFAQTRTSGVGTSGLTYPGGVKFNPNDTVVSLPIAASVSPTGSPVAATAPVPTPTLGSGAGSLGGSTKNTGLAFASSNQIRALSNPFRSTLSN